MEQTTSMEKSMRLRDLKDALKGKTRRVEELEEVLRQCLLACEATCSTLYCAPDDKQALEIIEEKCRAAIDNSK